MLNLLSADPEKKKGWKGGEGGKRERKRSTTSKCSLWRGRGRGGKIAGFVRSGQGGKKGEKKKKEGRWQVAIYGFPGGKGKKRGKGCFKDVVDGGGKKGCNGGGRSLRKGRRKKGWAVTVLSLLKKKASLTLKIDILKKKGSWGKVVGREKKKEGSEYSRETKKKKGGRRRTPRLFTSDGGERNLSNKKKKKR